MVRSRLHCACITLLTQRAWQGANVSGAGKVEVVTRTKRFGDAWECGLDEANMAHFGQATQACGM